MVQFSRPQLNGDARSCPDKVRIYIYIYGPPKVPIANPAIPRYGAHFYIFSVFKPFLGPGTVFFRLPLEISIS